ncbi:hypothetical protein MXL46_16105 [Heyndrickxia sporothermodurans]|uniref:Uncharacterized protein n=2 Tax=Heyndrickxia sporothermodurans TaxID=46224 RepID=A0A150KMJ3_9BACI|nr:hypothetical protein [Heyndrickxia sporothermodurans]KYC92937.1 hypothetical protein B4102_2047 [Heyndrickxia sporothermodurans]MBL5767612.1 hypothetical protein [Heyndrickxia sporothermodurans]MBL5771222.1 hypothetical protein [Heyndrickxia sporothermodurans]MBL5774783.1 hypothetical protein [Heyndrickxia sporothermodurans]MBL5778213.1 hypothetical protein [Heyndrickxia sporothermodurans]
MKGKQLGVSAIVAFVIVAFVLYQLDFFDRFKKSTTTEEELTRDVIKNNIEANSESPDKEKIVLKMLDSIDYFKDLQGEVEEYDKKYDQKTTYKFAVDVVNKRGIATTFTNNTPEDTIVILRKEDKKIMYDEKKHTYKTYKLLEDTKNEEISKQSATERLISDNRMDDDFGRVARNVVHSELSLLLKDFDSWNYSEATFSGIPSYKLTGVIDEKVSNSLAGKFEMIVTKNSGLVLDFKSYDENNTVKYYIKTRNIKIDRGLDKNIFYKEVSKYKKEK